MQLKYKISVIIPTFNAEDYLLEAVDSIKNQTMGFENIEVILVDDKSSDKTPDLIKELSQKYENVKSIILEENTGTASGPRNRGIKESSANYVIFLDNDAGVPELSSAGTFKCPTLTPERPALM